MTDSDGGRALAGHIRCTARATRRCLRVRSPASHPRTSPAPAIAPRRLLARPRALLGSPIPSAATLCLWQMVGSPSRSTRRRRSTYLFTAATPAFDSGGARAEHPHPARHSAGALMVTHPHPRRPRAQVRHRRLPPPLAPRQQGQAAPVVVAAVVGVRRGREEGRRPRGWRLARGGLRWGALIVMCGWYSTLRAIAYVQAREGEKTTLECSLCTCSLETCMRNSGTRSSPTLPERTTPHRCVTGTGPAGAGTARSPVAAAERYGSAHPRRQRRDGAGGGTSAT